MSLVKETRFWVQHESCGLNESACNSKRKWNLDECRSECKKKDDWSSCKYDYMRNPSTCDCECNKTCKIDKYLDINNCSREKCFSGKVALACKDEILNTIETSLNNKKVKKINALFTRFH